MNILFVNACLRDEASNTLALCRAALKTLLEKYPQAEVREVDLGALRLNPLYGEDVKRRSALHATGEYGDPIYAYAHEFAAADFVLLGAPYWDLSFPAALKVYLEHVCAADVTFAYTPSGTPYSLCRGQRLLYLTTSGAFVGEQNLGYDYVRALCETFFGFSKVSCFDVGGFDLGGDQQEILEAGILRLEAFLQAWDEEQPQA